MLGSVYCLSREHLWRHALHCTAYCGRLPIAMHSIPTTLVRERKLVETLFDRIKKFADHVNDSATRDVANSLTHKVKVTRPHKALVRNPT